jgi:type IV pilus assembly protein PilQ
MKIRKPFWTASLILLPALALAAKVTSIDFNSSDATSDIQIRSDAPVTFDKSENGTDKQIVIDLKGSTLSSTASRKLDTSSFDSDVMLVSPYSVDGGARVVIQLRDMAAATVTQNGNVLKISLPNGASGGKSADATPPAAATADAANSATDMPASPAVSEGAPAAATAAAAPVPSSSGMPDAQVGSVTTTPQAQAQAAENVGIKNKLDEFIESRETHRFVGKPITLKVRDADLVDVFRLIADTSGFNIIVGEEVKGKVTLSIEDVPWDQALDVILETQKLGAERTSNLLRIVTLANLTSEKQAELAAQQATEASAPRVTRVFPVNYAKLDDLTTILNKFVGNSNNAPSAAGAGLGAAALAQAASLSGSTVVQGDTRTNSIIVRATQENVERVHKLIQILDTQTPQVLIEGKVIEATEGFSKSIGGQIGFGKQNGTGQYFSSFAGADPVDPLFSINGSNSIFPTGGSQAAAAGSGGSFGLSPQLAFLPGNLRLNALLNLSESENSVRVISSPKAVVLDREKANIVQSTPVLTLTVAQTANGPVSIPSVQQANLSLDVTPTVTNEGSVLMQLSLSRDVPISLGSVNGQPSSAVANRNVSTRVLVESGSTLVMGGIYTMDQTKTSSGFPVLRKIPILGALFGSDSDSTTRSELFFFITPRILNLKESGISG